MMFKSNSSITFLLVTGFALGLAACSDPGPSAPTQGASESNLAAVGSADPEKSGPAELPIRIIPNMPSNAEVYYAPDGLHVIGQVKDPAAQQPAGKGRAGGALTFTFSDQGTDVVQINDRGMDCCSFFMPDMHEVTFTSTRDNMDMPQGDWANALDYPQGAELYIANADGSNIRRLTNNRIYDAEMSVSPDGRWLVFGRQTDGKMDLWRMRPDGSEQQQITFTDDWQEGAPYYYPDSETVLYRAWKLEDYGKKFPVPMTVFTIKHDGTEMTPRTFDNDMNWSAYPAPDGRHYGFVRIVDGRNWEIFLGDLTGGDPVRLTYNDGFDGLPTFSPDGRKMLFSRNLSGEYMSGSFTHVMDVSSLNLGPENYAGVPGIELPQR